LLEKRGGGDNSTLKKKGQNLTRREGRGEKGEGEGEKTEDFTAQGGGGKRGGNPFYCSIGSMPYSKKPGPNFLREREGGKEREFLQGSFW